MDTKGILGAYVHDHYRFPAGAAGIQLLGTHA
jgi:hypothetical protein